MTTDEVVAHQMLIGGARRPAASGRVLESIDPSTGQVWCTIPAAEAADVDEAVRSARSAFDSGPWSTMTATERGRALFRLADVVEAHADELARIESRDNGKLLREAEAQVGSLPRWLRFYGGLADKVNGQVPPSDFPTVLNYITDEPVGVVAGLVPWNSPLSLAVWKIAPALAVGNTMVLKPSEVASASLLTFAGLFEEAGFPPGVFNVVTGDGAGCGLPLVSHPDVAHVTFTGGPQTAVAIAHAAADRLTPLTFELGGKSANVVFEDADLDAAEVGVLAGIFGASGQTCIAGSRLLVQASIADELLARLKRRAEAIVLGDPADPATQMGPIAAAAQFQHISGLVDRAREQGAHALAGGGPVTVEGSTSPLFFAPTILSDVKPDMEIAQSEVFGPVLVVVVFEDEEEAIEIANGTPYGLAAGIWTRDLRRAHTVARRLDAGTVWVNTYRVASPLSPSGGSGMSGYGRENGVDAVREFTKTKSVVIELSDEIRDPFVVRLSS